MSTLFVVFFPQGTGRYAIYIANYASGNVGPHALIEMDEAASDLSQGVIALSNVAEQAGVNKFTGRYIEMMCVTYTLSARTSSTTGPSALIYTDVCRGACACCACTQRVWNIGRWSGARSWWGGSSGRVGGVPEEKKKSERKKENMTSVSMGEEKDDWRERQEVFVGSFGPVSCLLQPKSEDAKGDTRIHQGSSTAQRWHLSRPAVVLQDFRSCVCTVRTWTLLRESESVLL